MTLPSMWVIDFPMFTTFETGGCVISVWKKLAHLASQRRGASVAVDDRVTHAIINWTAILIMTTLHKVLDKSQARLYNTMGNT